MKKIHIFVFILGFFVSTIAISASKQDSNLALKKKNSVVLMAKKSKKKSKRPGFREKRIVREKSYSAKPGNNKTSIDFDDERIIGERKSSIGSLIEQSKANLDYDFIKIRLSWHPEMIRSAQSLEINSI